MTRTKSAARSTYALLLQGFLAVGGVVAIGFFPASCQTGGIGDPCTPEDEYLGTFAGFKVTQENIESRSFQCESRICLVAHFQGRVSCPAGQPIKTPCREDSECTGEGEACRESATFAPSCTNETAEQDCASLSGACNKEGFCECSDDTCPEGYFCDGDSKQCKLFVCHKEGNCQDPTKDLEFNKNKDCCIPGTDTPVASEVCGQCEADGLRDAAGSVYCSCRCGVAEGQPEDENFNFCECPDGFQCAEVRPDVGLGDTQLTGKYCVKADDGIVTDGKVDVALAAGKCGFIEGHKGENCEGQSAPPTE
jgi:hypothetical protein